ncbi:tigger transposable element-derived protein 1-like [Macrobrachium rosenbergii]|uniref:tigger transposable element-derived protein 1-like n=1 Tax=Macrobrachium rosenbergii TaxID=79674 RepID=UPI0034D62256
MNHLAIGTVLKNKNKIMEHMKSAVPVQSTILSKRRGRAAEEMEKLLGIWMEHQRQRSVLLSLTLIQEKAKSLFNDLRAKAGISAQDETFVASHGWFHRFKKRANLHHVSVSGEAASTDKAEAKKLSKTLKEIIDKGGYIPQQIFNVDETTFSGKMPGRLYISCEGKTMPGFKAVKDRLTLLLGGNCSVDM